VKTTPLSSFWAPRYWPTWLGLALLRLIGLLPLPVVALLGKSIGFLSYYLISSRRRIAYINIRSCFPELSDKACKKINFQHFLFVGQSLFTGTMTWWNSTDRFNRLVETKGKEHFDKAIADERNIIILAPHFMGLEVAGHVLSQEQPMLSMYQYAKNGLVDEIVKRGRCRYGGVMVERKEPMRNLIRSIRKGHPFYYLPDQDAGRKGLFVPFFHDLASTYSMLGKFAKMTNALVIPCRTIMKPWGRGYLVELGEPLKDFPQGDDLIDTTTMNQAVSNLIRPYPEHYFWAHKRFKTRPPEEESQDVNFYK